MNPFRSAVTGDIDWGAVVLVVTFLAALVMVVLLAVLFSGLPPHPCKSILMECMP